MFLLLNLVSTNRTSNQTLWAQISLEGVKQPNQMVKEVQPEIAVN